MGLLVVVLARLVRRGLFRRFEVVGLDRLSRDQPVLLVANHFNGFVDVIVVVAAIGRLPRFVAKATIAANPFIRLALRMAGVVLVHRPEDAGGAADNTEMFAETTRALNHGAMVALFPEGTTHDRTSLARIHTGAARIAIGARAAGTTGVAIVPVGLTYHDKVALRSSVLVQVGEAIDVVSAAVDDRDAVRDCTELIDLRLRSLSPNFDDPAEWAAIDLAAEVSLRTPGGSAGSLFERAERVAALGRVDAADRRCLTDTLGRYHLALAASHLDDEQVVTGAPLRLAVRPLVTAAVALTVFWPVVAFGLLANAVPTLVVGASGLLVSAAVTKGTVRVLTGLVVFPLSWIVAALILADTPWSRVGLFLAAPAAGLFALGALAAVFYVFAQALDWRAVTERRAAVEQLREQRASVVALIDGMLAPMEAV